MKIDMGESLVLSWLKHVKRCQVVNTNWKASPYWTPAVSDDEISRLYNAAYDYFCSHELLILERSDERGGNIAESASWQSMLLQTECDAVGLAHVNGAETALIYAVESAFHRNKIHYSKQKSSWRPLHLSGSQVTAWNVALKMFKNALSMYRWYGTRNAHLVLVAPMSSESVEVEILEACSQVMEFYRVQGFQFEFEFYFEHAREGSAGSFAECVRAPVNLAATVVDDTSELYLRGHVLDSNIPSIDVSMLDLSRRLLDCENLDEMAGLYLDSAVEILDAINRIRNLIVTAIPEDDLRSHQRQRQMFDRCHGALRSYFAVLHELDGVPSLATLQRMMPGHESVVATAVGARGEAAREMVSVQVVLDPADSNEFKQQLLRTHLARRTRIFSDGRAPIVDEWRAEAFTENSNLMGNIKSSAAYRNAARDGVVRLEFSIVTA